MPWLARWSASEPLLNNTYISLKKHKPQTKIDKKILFDSSYCYAEDCPIIKYDLTGESTHTDNKGNVIAVYKDNDFGVYSHNKLPENYATTSNDIADDKKRLTGGAKKGETLSIESFTFEYGNGKYKPLGTIKFDSFAARDEINKFENEFKELAQKNPDKLEIIRYYYAINAGQFDKYDYKSQPYKERQLSPSQYEKYVRRGSQISPGFYVSARDVGNFEAGAIARITKQDKLDFLITAGAFNLHGNKKFDLVWNLEKYKKEASQLAPYYGEAKISNTFQRYGYHNIRSWEDYRKGGDPWKD